MSAPEEEPRHLVVMTLAVRFRGTYVLPGEMVSQVESWVDGGLEDRDDVEGWSVSGHLIELPEGTEWRGK